MFDDAIEVVVDSSETVCENRGVFLLDGLASDLFELEFRWRSGWVGDRVGEFFKVCCGGDFGGMVGWRFAVGVVDVWGRLFEGRQDPKRPGFLLVLFQDLAPLGSESVPSEIGFQRHPIQALFGSESVGDHLVVVGFEGVIDEGSLGQVGHSVVDSVPALHVGLALEIVYNWIDGGGDNYFLVI